MTRKLCKFPSKDNVVEIVGETGSGKSAYAIGLAVKMAAFGKLVLLATDDSATELMAQMPHLDIVGIEHQLSGSTSRRFAASASTQSTIMASFTRSSAT
jgi:KaiC/GvpD/RAD55 family RecA-like ATPase